MAQARPPNEALAKAWARRCRSGGFGLPKGSRQTAEICRSWIRGVTNRGYRIRLILCEECPCIAEEKHERRTGSLRAIRVAEATR